MRRFALVFFVFNVSACSPPLFEFRGYTDQSSCTEILAAELSNGGQVAGIENKVVPRFGELSITEIQTQMYASDATAQIVCQSNDQPHTVLYTVQGGDSTDLDLVFDRFYDGLTREFGAAQITKDRIGRSANFSCGETGTVQLAQEHSNAFNQVTLFVIFRSRVC